MIHKDELIDEKEDDEQIIVPLSFHDSKKYRNFPILISQDLADKLTRQYTRKAYFKLINILNKECDAIYFQFSSRNITENINNGGISILDHIIKNSGWSIVRQDVEINKVESIKEIELKMVELSLPEIRISPRDLWYYERSLIGKILYNEISQINFETNEHLPINVTAMGTEDDNEHFSYKKMKISGLVTDNTNFVIVPKSVRIIIVIILSREFFNYSSSGFLWWRGIISFFKEYLTSSKQSIENHFISVLLSWKIRKDDNKSEDYFHVFWEGILSQITVTQTSINDFVENLRLILNRFQKDKEFIKSLVSYCESNILESINLSVTQLKNDLIDGSLVWTGRNIKILNSGPPIIVSDSRDYQRLLNLSKITEVKFLKTSITCHFISFSELDWYNSLSIHIIDSNKDFHQETTRIINLKLPIVILYYKINNTLCDYGQFNLSSTITLLDDFISNRSNDICLNNDSDKDDLESDIDLFLNNSESFRIRRILNKPQLNFQECLNCNSNNLKGNNYINQSVSLKNSLRLLLLPLTTNNLSKIWMDNNMVDKDLFISDIQKVSNWTLTPRKELFLAYYWKNYKIGNSKLIVKNTNDFSILMDKPEYKDFNIQILRLIFYELIVQRMSMSFQISTIKSKNIIEHYNSENIQMLKCYNSLSKCIAPNYNYIHQLSLLKDDNNILVEVINIIVKDNQPNAQIMAENDELVNIDKSDEITELQNSNVNQNSNLICNDSDNGNNAGFINSHNSVPYYILHSKSENKYEKTELNTGIDDIINYRYEYNLSRYDYNDDKINKKKEWEFSKYYTIFNNLSNVKYSVIDEILVWQKDVPFIDELISESFNELLNYNFDKNNFDYYYLLTSYISCLSINYTHFAVVPYIKINNTTNNKMDNSKINQSIKLLNEEIYPTNYLDCYSNYYKDCCLDSILNNWLKLNTLNNNCQLIENDMIDETLGRIDDECLNMKNLKRITEYNIKCLIKSLESFFFKNAPSEYSLSLEVEIMNDTNYVKNERKSIKILYSWCESFVNNKESKNETNESNEIFINSNDYFQPINWFVLYYDSIWHPLLPFKFSLGWLSCPTHIISRIIIKIKYILINYYFTLIQIRSSDIYSSYEISLEKSIPSSYIPLNPPYYIKFKQVIPSNIIKLLLKKFISFPLSLQLLYYDHSHMISRYFLIEPHSIYTLELNKKGIIIRKNYYQTFWKHHFQYDSYPILKCPCSSSLFDKSWRNHLFNSHFIYINEILHVNKIPIH
ncbi:Vacuolar membrane-associated protein Iml1 [Cryptosporidium felis]|nr:Vacuolar membrane-associated protein Iml1 [Cryptosporidium felis]